MTDDDVENTTPPPETPTETKEGFEETPEQNEEQTSNDVGEEEAEEEDNQVPKPDILAFDEESINSLEIIVKQSEMEEDMQNEIINRIIPAAFFEVFPSDEINALNNAGYTDEADDIVSRSLWKWKPVKGNEHQRITSHLKYRLDERFGFGWTVCIGRSFGSALTYRTRRHLFCYVRDLGVLLWKC